MAEPGIYLKTEEGLIPGATVPGPVGETGPGATVSVGSVITGAAGTNASVINTGTPEAAVLSFTIPRGNTGLQGIQGATGATGPAGTISIGTVTVAPAGSTPTITNTGTPSAAVLNFVVPKGDKGDQGIQGIQGPKGDPGSINSINGDLGPDVILDAADVGAAPTVHTHTKSQITDFAHTHGGADITGTGKSATTFLRGDNTWVVPTDTTYAIPSQAEAEAGTATTARAFSAQRVNQAIQALAPIKSVAGKTGVITLVKADVGLGNVDNTSDANKPISTATQTALNAKADLIGGLVPTSQLPPLAINEIFTVASQAAMLALTAQRGDMAIRTDNGKTYVLSSDSPSTLADWKEVMATGQVVSVAGKTGTVTLDAADITSGTFVLARLPVATSGTSSATQIVRADDSRLSNARTPTAHTHAAADVNSGTLDIARLPVATSGTSNATQVVRADDSRLSNARTPTTHTHTKAQITDFAHTHAAGDITSGIISTARLGTGTADATTYLRGDGSWALIETTGTVPIQTTEPVGEDEGTFWYDSDEVFDGYANVTRVLHNGTAYPARPTGATYVEWVGPVAPTAQITGDTWVNTA